MKIVLESSLSALTQILLADYVTATIVHFTVDDVKYQAECSSSNMIDLSLVSIGLLSQESTTKKPVINEQAEGEFIKALGPLVQSKTPFYTQVHPDWERPALKWYKAKKRE
jgi:hypothetical protein